MRPFFCALFVCVAAAPVLAEPARVLPTSEDLTAPDGFALGGAAIKSAFALEDPPEKPARRTLTLPIMGLESRRREADLIGGLSLFASEGWDAGRDAFQMGTAYRQGLATAGFSVTYIDEQSELARSELYLDFAVSQNITVGLSGILDSETYESDDPRSPQLGLSAAYETGNGAVFEGGIAGAAEADPIFGLSIGLRF